MISLFLIAHSWFICIFYTCKPLHILSQISRDLNASWINWNCEHYLDNVEIFRGLINSKLHLLYLCLSKKQQVHQQWEMQTVFGWKSWPSMTIPVHLSLAAIEGFDAFLSLVWFGLVWHCGSCSRVIKNDSTRTRTDQRATKKLTSLSQRRRNGHHKCAGERPANRTLNALNERRCARRKP